MKTIPISKFKATCLAVLEEVRTSGQPVLVTKRGKPVAEIVPPSTSDGETLELGTMAGTATIVGDIISPLDVRWEALES